MGHRVEVQPVETWRIWQQHRETLLAHWREKGIRAVPWAVRAYDRRESPETLPFVSPYTTFRPKETSE